MKTKLFVSAAALALIAGGAFAQDLKFKPGEDAKFNWASYDEWDAKDLSGQALRIDGPCPLAI